jgi:hypothetical protein
LGWVKGGNYTYLGIDYSQNRLSVTEIGLAYWVGSKKVTQPNPFTSLAGGGNVIRKAVNNTGITWRRDYPDLYLIGEVPAPIQLNQAIHFLQHQTPEWLI